MKLRNQFVIAATALTAVVDVACIANGWDPMVGFLPGQFIGYTLLPKLILDHYNTLEFDDYSGHFKCYMSAFATPMTGLIGGAANTALLYGLS